MTGSIVGALTRSSSDVTSGFTVAPVRNVPVWHLAELLPAAMHPSKRYQIRTLAGGYFTGRYPRRSFQLPFIHRE